MPLRSHPTATRERRSPLVLGLCNVLAPHTPIVRRSVWLCLGEVGHSMESALRRLRPTEEGCRDGNRQEGQEYR